MSWTCKVRFTWHSAQQRMQLLQVPLPLTSSSCFQVLSLLTSVCRLGFITLCLWPGRLSLFAWLPFFLEELMKYTFASLLFLRPHTSSPPFFSTALFSTLWALFKALIPLQRTALFITDSSGKEMCLCVPNA